MLALGLLSACGGGGSSPTTSATPPATGGASKAVVLDAGTFDTQVLAAARPSLVEFHSPT